MSSQASLTNQRIDIARRFLLMPTTDQTWMEVAYENAATFHIQSAFVSLLQEVKNEHLLHCEPNVDAILQAAEKKKTSSPILIELAELIKKKHSWLNLLFDDYHKKLMCDPSILDQHNNNIISSSKSITYKSSDYLDALTEIVLRFREESIEY